MSAKTTLTLRATDYLQRNGMDNQSLRAIASGIGTSHRMLIYHFGSREGLFTAVVDGLWERIHSVLTAVPEQFDGDLGQLGRELWNTVVEAEALAPIFFELSAPAMRDAAWAHAFRTGSATLTKQLMLLLESAGHSPQHAESVARMTMYVVRGALWELAITKDRATADIVVQKFLAQHWTR